MRSALLHIPKTFLVLFVCMLSAGAWAFGPEENDGACPFFEIPVSSVEVPDVRDARFEKRQEIDTEHHHYVLYHDTTQPELEIAVIEGSEPRGTWLNWQENMFLYHINSYYPDTVCMRGIFDVVLKNEAGRTIEFLDISSFARRLQERFAP